MIGSKRTSPPVSDRGSFMVYARGRQTFFDRGPDDSLEEQPRAGPNKIHFLTHKKLLLSLLASMQRMNLFCINKIIDFEVKRCC